MRRTVGAAGVAGLLLAGAVGCGAWGQQHRTVSYEVPGQVTELVVTGDAGGIEVRAGDGPAQVVEKRSWSGDTEPQAAHSLADGVLKLSYSCSGSGCGMGYQVRVPAGTKLRLTQGSGGIRLHGMAGDIEAKVDSGGIDADGLRARGVRLTVGSGGLDAGFTEAPDRAELSTGSGGLKLKVPAGAQYQVDAHADSGGTDVTVPSAAGAPHVLVARVGSGGLKVTTG
ncbi:DUF4097 family beta strand repeat-containing protein [Kitasatospora sp. NPDC088391]|uniref:DUF4097 family beta strand repeat-containing protein n=1 Tax=Kitasatospora sp. NPDC088391 TaxID=3364074 RepID=UPI0037FCE9D3